MVNWGEKPVAFTIWRTNQESSKCCSLAFHQNFISKYISEPFIPEPFIPLLTFRKTMFLCQEIVTCFNVTVTYQLWHSNNGKKHPENYALFAEDVWSNRNKPLLHWVLQREYHALDGQFLQKMVHWLKLCYDWMSDAVINRHLWRNVRVLPVW